MNTVTMKRITDCTDHQTRASYLAIMNCKATAMRLPGCDMLHSFHGHVTENTVKLHGKVPSSIQRRLLLRHGACTLERNVLVQMRSLNWSHPLHFLFLLHSLLNFKDTSDMDFSAQELTDIQRRQINYLNYQNAPQNTVLALKNYRLLRRILSNVYQ
jgi:hypothetical protein